MWFRRKIEKISSTHCVRNEKVLKESRNREISYVSEKKENQLDW